MFGLHKILDSVYLPKSIHIGKDPTNNLHGGVRNVGVISSGFGSSMFVRVSFLLHIGGIFVDGCVGWSLYKIFLLLFT